MLWDWKLVKDLYLVYLQRNVNENSSNVLILTFHFDDVTVEIGKDSYANFWDHFTFLGNYPSAPPLKPILTLTSHLGPNVGLGEG